MPQLDIDILEDFLFFAFVALLLGLGDDETEEAVITRHADAHLATYYLATRKALRAETDLIAQAPRVALIPCPPSRPWEYLDGSRSGLLIRPPLVQF